MPRPMSTWCSANRLASWRCRPATSPRGSMVVRSLPPLPLRMVMPDATGLPDLVFELWLGGVLSNVGRVSGQGVSANSC